VSPGVSLDGDAFICGTPNSKRDAGSTQMVPRHGFRVRHQSCPIKADALIAHYPELKAAHSAVGSHNRASQAPPSGPVPASAAWTHPPHAQYASDPGRLPPSVGWAQMHIPTPVMGTVGCGVAQRQ
jgi:hypothetical protein